VRVSLRSTAPALAKQQPRQLPASRTPSIKEKQDEQEEQTQKHANIAEPESTVIEPTQSLENFSQKILESTLQAKSALSQSTHVQQELQESKQPLSQETLTRDPQQDTNTLETSSPETLLVANSDHSTLSSTSNTTSNTTDNQDTYEEVSSSITTADHAVAVEATSALPELEGPDTAVTTQTIQAQYAPVLPIVNTNTCNTQTYPPCSSYTSSRDTQQQGPAPGKKARRKKRYVNKRLQAATQTADEREFIQACQAALRSVTQRSDTRTHSTSTTSRNYKKLEQQAAQAGISVEHMAAVQDQLTHMKYAHYESKAQQILRKTSNIHRISVSIEKPILQYLDILITVNKQGKVLHVKFCTVLPSAVEQAITKTITLSQFPPVPDHFNSPEHTFAYRPFADLKEGGGYLVYS